MKLPTMVLLSSQILSGEMLGEKLKSLLKIYGNTLTVILATREMKMISFTTKVSLACLSLYIGLPTWIS